MQETLLMSKLDRFQSHQDIPTFTSGKSFLFSILIIVAFGFYSCSKENTTISEQVNTLIQSLQAENPNCSCDPYLSQCVWRNETVYVLGYRGPQCSWRPTFYDSNGQEFTLPVGYTYEQFDQESTFIKDVWTCK